VYEACCVPRDRSRVQARSAENGALTDGHTAQHVTARDTFMMDGVLYVCYAGVLVRCEWVDDESSHLFAQTDEIVVKR